MTRLTAGSLLDGLTPVYQGQFDLRTGVLHGAEALARWPQVTGASDTEAVIAYAERSGEVADLDRAMIDVACRQLHEWDRLLRGVPRVAVNVAGASLLRPGLFDTVTAAVDRYGLDPQRLTLELTERTQVPEHARKDLRRLRALGVRLSIDDFGTGYANLAGFLDHPFDEAKLDRSLLAAHKVDERSHAVVEGILRMLLDVGVGVVVEGIETLDDLRFLGALPASVIGQGYLLGMPTPDAPSLHCPVPPATFMGCADGALLPGFAPSPRRRSQPHG